MVLRYIFNKKAYPDGSKLTVPFGVKSMKIRTNADYAVIKEIGSIASNTVNISSEIKFPIVNGKSPNTFVISGWGW